MNDHAGQSRELQQLVIGLIDGTLSDEQLRRLEALLADDPKMRAAFHEQLWMHATLMFGQPKVESPSKHPTTAEEFARYVRLASNQNTGAQPAQTLHQQLESIPKSTEGNPGQLTPAIGNPSERDADASTYVSRPPISFWTKLLPRHVAVLSPSSLLGILVMTFALGAVSTVVAMIGVPTLARQGDASPIALQQEQIQLTSNAATNPAYVARLTGTHRAEWTDRFASPVNQQFLELHQKLELTQGWAEITFKSGARIVIEGPAALEMESPNGARLAAGKLVAEVPEQAVGFTVETPAAEIHVDQTADFGMQATAEGGTEISISTGEVELVPAESVGSASRKFAPSGAKQRLVAGQSLQVRPLADGLITAIPLPFDRNRFARTMPMRFLPVQQPRLFAAVQLPAGATLITPTIQAFSSEHPGYPPIVPPRAAVNLINGSGLRAGPSGILGAADSTHDDAQHTVWHQATRGKGADTFVLFDLGGHYDIATTRIWNLNQLGALGNGAKDVEISVSADNVNYVLLATIALLQGSGTRVEPAQDFATIASNIRYVQFNIPTGFDETSEHSGGGFKGLAEVRFEGTAVHKTVGSGDQVAASRPTRTPYSARDPIHLERLFDDKSSAALDEALITDTYAAVPVPENLGVESVVFDGPSRMQIAPGLMFDFSNLGWAPSRSGAIANGGIANPNPIRTTEPFLEVEFGKKCEDGIGMHADALITFDLDEIRQAGQLSGQSFRFISDRAGVNGCAKGSPESSVNLVVLVAAKQELLSAFVNGERVAIRRSGDTWHITNPPGKPLRADGRFVRFDLDLPPSAKYLTLVATDAGDDVHADHVAWSGARLQFVEATENPE